MNMTKNELLTLVKNELEADVENFELLINDEDALTEYIGAIEIGEQYVEDTMLMNMVPEIIDEVIDFMEYPNILQEQKNNYNAMIAL